MIDLSILIPVFNEEKTIGLLIQRLGRTLSAAKITYEVIIIDDHSTDSTREVVKQFSKMAPVKLLTKQGSPGKAFSILEGAKIAKAPLLCMIDGDLQYPPEVIPTMVGLSREHGVVVARRISYDGSALRRLGSRTLAFLCGRLLLGFSCDMQSGLKVFRAGILDIVDQHSITPWAIDLPLLHAAKELGFTIGEVEITFEKRLAGHSKLSLLRPTLQIASSAVALRLRHTEPRSIEAEKQGNMLGAGVIHKSRRFITHTTLHHRHSALTTFTSPQRLTIFSLLLFLSIGLLTSPLQTTVIVVGILSFIYFIDVIFNLFLIIKSLHSPPEILATQTEIDSLRDKDLPTYTILCPLYKEAHVIPHFLHAIAKLNWPHNKLEVLLLLEEDDTESISAVKQMQLPAYARTVVVPHSYPKTKPKACNYGLNLAKGEYVVIYDAEDIPEPEQLKKAYIGFGKVGPGVQCLQAKLNYYNPHQNWLTRFFTAEYSLWFDVILTGLQSIGTTIPLGGTSNHFRTQDLLELEGWDPFNVTEDCDLGVRLFKKGYKTAIIDSTTLEEANSNFKNWLRQRSRWIKGYMQTYLIHMRDPLEFAQKQGIHALLFQLSVGGKLAFILINPILWVMTISYFTLNAYVGPTIEALYPSIVFYMAATSLIFGNFMFIFYYMIGCAKREHWSVIKWVYLVPFYWLMVSIAGCIALYQLIVKPHYWEKTVHGLHLKKKITEEAKRGARLVLLGSIAGSILNRVLIFRSGFSFLPIALIHLHGFAKKWRRISLAKLFKQAKSPTYRGGIILIIASMLGNVFNMLANLYSGKQLSFVQFGALNTFISLYYLVNIPTGAFSSMINHHIAFLTGKDEKTSLLKLLRYLRKKTFFFSLIGLGTWWLCVPLLSRAFHSVTPGSLVIFSFVWLFAALIAVDRGYLRGRLSFELVAIVVFIETFTRLLSTFLLVRFLPDAVYLSIPFSVGVSWLSAFVFIQNNNPTENSDILDFTLPWRFFFLSFIAGLSTIAFFTIDTIMVSALLPAHEAGMYGFLGLLGKMIYFAGGLILTFITPIISYAEGKRENTQRHFMLLLSATVVISLGVHIGVGLLLPYFSPAILGEKFRAIAPFLPLYGLGVACFTISQFYVSYYLAKKIFAFPIVAFLLSLIQIIGLTIFHGSISQVVTVMTVAGIINLVTMSLLDLNYRRLKVPLENINDFLDLFSFSKWKRTPSPDPTHLRILILNWRDGQHRWAGGAEVYVQEMAKRWVNAGHVVTIFCGNDGRSTRNDEVGGVHIIRRGGFYTVYIWAFLYYFFHLRHAIDVVVDSENGIPFLTPLYVRKPVLLLIHHVHQEIFRTQLPLILSSVAIFIEGVLMPHLYRNKKIITVSRSSKDEIIKLGLGSEESISIIHPGVGKEKFHLEPKSTTPLFVYVGRLKRYKKIDVAIQAFERLQKNCPDAQFIIGGAGEAEKELKNLVAKLGLEKKVLFLGFLSETDKSAYLARAWAAVQPSMIEGWGITVIEANACGTPVIASNVHGLRDSIVDGSTGFLFPAGDHKSLSKIMEKVCTNKVLVRRLAENAITWSSNFDWDKSATKFLGDVRQEHQNYFEGSLIDSTPLTRSLLSQPGIFTMMKAAFVSLLLDDPSIIKLPQRIGKYKLLFPQQKATGHREYAIGVYTDGENQYLIKTWAGKHRNFLYYDLLREYLASTALHALIQTKKVGPRISTPKPIGHYKTKYSLSIIFEYVDGVTLYTQPISRQVKVMDEVLHTLKSVLIEENGGFIHVRSKMFYLASLPYLALLTFLKIPTDFPQILRGLLLCLRNIPKDGGQYHLAHRDLTLDNIILKDSSYFLIDLGKLCWTIPGYDLANLALSSKAMEVKTEILKNRPGELNKFLLAYLAVQNLSAPDKIGVGNVYKSYLCLGDV